MSRVSASPAPVVQQWIKWFTRLYETLSHEADEVEFLADQETPFEKMATLVGWNREKALTTPVAELIAELENDPVHRYDTYVWETRQFIQQWRLYQTFVKARNPLALQELERRGGVKELYFDRLTLPMLMDRRENSVWAFIERRYGGPTHLQAVEWPYLYYREPIQRATYAKDVARRRERVRLLPWHYQTPQERMDLALSDADRAQLRDPWSFTEQLRAQLTTHVYELLYQGIAAARQSLQERRQRQWTGIRLRLHSEMSACEQDIQDLLHSNRAHMVPRVDLDLDPEELNKARLSMEQEVRRMSHQRPSEAYDVLKRWRGRMLEVVKQTRVAITGVEPVEAQQWMRYNTMLVRHEAYRLIVETVNTSIVGQVEAGKVEYHDPGVMTLLETIVAQWSKYTDSVRGILDQLHHDLVETHLEQRMASWRKQRYVIAVRGNVAAHMATILEMAGTLLNSEPPPPDWKEQILQLLSTPIDQRRVLTGESATQLIDTQEQQWATDTGDILRNEVWPELQKTLARYLAVMTTFNEPPALLSPLKDPLGLPASLLTETTGADDDDDTSSEKPYRQQPHPMISFRTPPDQVKVPFQPWHEELVQQILQPLAQEMHKVLVDHPSEAGGVWQKMIHDLEMTIQTQPPIAYTVTYYWNLLPSFAALYGWVQIHKSR